MTTSREGIKVRQAIGIFFDRDHLDAAIGALRSAGFEHDQLGLLASEQTIEKSLSDIYEKTNRHTDITKEPQMAYAIKEANEDNFWSRSGGLFFAGSTAATGAVVATAAILGGPLVVAAAAAASAGVLGAATATMISKGDAAQLGEQVDQGHILLFVRVPDTASESTAVQILSLHSGLAARVCDT